MVAQLQKDEEVCRSVNGSGNWGANIEQELETQAGSVMKAVAHCRDQAHHQSEQCDKVEPERKVRAFFFHLQYNIRWKALA